MAGHSGTNGPPPGGHPFGTRLVYRSDHKPLETTAPETPAPTIDVAERVKHFLHVLIEPRSYLNAVYLLTAFPLGLTYFFVLTAGIISGALSSLVLAPLLSPPPPPSSPPRFS